MLTMVTKSENEELAVFFSRFVEDFMKESGIL